MQVNNAELSDIKTIDYSLKIAKNKRENTSSSKFDKTNAPFQSASMYLEHNLLGTENLKLSFWIEKHTLLPIDGNASFCKFMSNYLHSLFINYYYKI